MKTIGLLGGMNWESTLGYYRTINQDVNQSLGGLHSAKAVKYATANYIRGQIQLSRNLDANIL